MKVKSESEVAQLCPTLSDPMDCSLPGSSVYGIFQARVLEWGAIAFSIVIINLSKFREIMKDMEAWHAAVHGVGHNLVAEQQQERRIEDKPVVTVLGEGNGTPFQYSCLENPMD